MLDRQQPGAPQPTILVVDDEPLLRRLMAHILADSGFEIVEAENGEEALDAARRCRGVLSLVVTDVNMPVMGGLEFAREFRPLNPAVPILFISGRPEAARLENDLLRKPFEAEDLLAAVARMLARRPGVYRTTA